MSGNTAGPLGQVVDDYRRALVDEMSRPLVFDRLLANRPESSGPVQRPEPLTVGGLIALLSEMDPTAEVHVCGAGWEAEFDYAYRVEQRDGKVWID